MADNSRGFAMFGAARGALGGGESRVSTTEQVTSETRVVIPVKHAVVVFFCILGGLGGIALFLLTLNWVLMGVAIALVISCLLLGMNQTRYLQLPHWSTETPDDVAKRELLYPAFAKALYGDEEEWGEMVSTIPVQSRGQQTRTIAAPNGKIQIPDPDDLNYLEFLKGAIDIGFARDGVWFKKPRRKFVLTGEKVVKSKYDEMIAMCVRRNIVQPGGGGSAHTLVDGVDLEEVYEREVKVIRKLFPDWVELNPRFDAVHST